MDLGLFQPPDVTPPREESWTCKSRFRFDTGVSAMIINSRFAKADKLLHFFERLTLIEVIVDLKHEHRIDVEFHAYAEHKHDFVAHESNAELMPALDLALDKVIHQIHRYKEKIQDHRRDVPTGTVAETPSDGGDQG